MHSTQKQKQNKKKTERKNKRRERNGTWKIERDIGLQDEVKEEREKPELYLIQSFKSQIIIDEVRLIWLKTIGE